jgi:hypothetical protein
LQVFITVQVCCGQHSSQHAPQLRAIPQKLASAELAAITANTTAVSDMANIRLIA